MHVKHNLLWIESPFFQRELKESGLSEEDKAFVKQYADNGYVVFDPQIDPRVFEDIKNDLQDQFYPGSAGKKDLPVVRIQDAWKYSKGVKNLATLPSVERKLQLLYGRKPIPFQTLNFNVGTQQSTHSDMIHFSSIPERFMCGVWIAFEDIDIDNGPLHYYPGSHKLPFYEMSDMGVKGSDSRRMKNGYMDYEGYYVEFIQEVVKDLALEKKVLTVKKGQAMIWAANLLHGGEKINRVGSTRFSQVNHYYFEDCVYYTPLFSDLAIKKIYLRSITDISTGKIVENKYLGDVVKDPMGGVKNKILDMLPKQLIRIVNSVRRK